MNQQVFDPGRKEFSPYGFSCTVWQLQSMSRPDRHNEIELNFTDSSGFTYLFGGRRESVHRGKLALFWAATPHQIIEYPLQSSYYVVTIPLAWFLGWKLPRVFTEAVLNGAILEQPDESMCSIDMQLFSQWVKDFDTVSSEHHEVISLEVEARVRRMALSYSKVSASVSLHGRSAGEVSKIEQIAAWIAQHYTEPVQLIDIGKAAGLHPNYVANLFQKTFGTTVNSYIIAHRVAHAQRLLMSTDEKIVSVALASGFNSLSRFNDAFKRACGCTPREYRKKYWKQNPDRLE